MKEKNDTLNLYVIEDHHFQIKDISKTISCIISDLVYLDHEKHDSIRIHKLNPSEIPMRIDSDLQCKDYMEKKFTTSPPHVIVLDWELFWGSDEIDPTYKGYSYDGDQVLRFIDSKTAYVPYILFTTARPNRSFPSIVEGEGLARLLPHTINLLKKSFFKPNEDNGGYEYGAASEAIRMAIDFALSKRIKLTIFDFPDVNHYRHTLSGKEKDHRIWSPVIEQPFAVTGKVKKEIYVTQEEIVTIIYANEKYSIVLWREKRIELYMCHFSSKNGKRVAKKHVHALFPFLISADSLLYNRKYFIREKPKYKFGINHDGFHYKKFIQFLSVHVSMTADYWIEIDNLTKQQINPFYDAFRLFMGVDELLDKN